MIDINLVNLLSLGGIHFHFRGRNNKEETVTAAPSVSSGDSSTHLKFSPKYSSDAEDARKGELSDEHDGSPIYVNDIPMYLVGGAVVEDVIDVPGFGDVHVRIELFHRKGQVYLRIASLDNRLSGSGFKRITGAVVSLMAPQLEEQKVAGARPRSG